jgi:EAL domain-containing protein (putative c-di-GMP-specific phosphodiesterase class I)
LNQIKERGIALAIDDFGTGYSSLSYLKNFPLDRIKIDRSFLAEVVQSRDDAAIVAAIITMAATLNLRVMAEGVETREQLDFLIDRGCHETQGYFFSRPITAEALAALVIADFITPPGASLTP